MFVKKWNNKHLKKDSDTFLKYSSLAFEMAAMLLLPILGGRWADSQTGTRIPWFTLLGAVIGISAAIYYAIKDFIRKK